MRFFELLAGLVCLLIVGWIGAGMFMVVDLETREESKDGSWIAQD